MNLDKITKWRNLVSRIGTLLCTLFILAALDGLASQLRHPHNSFDLLPGESLSINGSLAERTTGVEELEYSTNSSLVSLSFQGIQPGFWTGAAMWNGVVKLDPAVEPGEYNLTVRKKEYQSPRPPEAFILKIHKDHESIRKNSESYCIRLFDVSPWWIFGTGVLSALMVFGGVYLLSGKRDALLAQEGKAEIYRIARESNALLIAFGLGISQGIHPGDQLRLLDAKGSLLGTITVRDAYEKDSTAIIASNTPVKPGCIVSLY